MDRFRALVAAQGGDVVSLSAGALPVGAYSRDHHRRRAVARWRASTRWRWVCGVAARRGPLRPGERVQSGAGLRIHRRPGEPVAAGEALFTLYTDTPERFAAAMAELDGGWSVGDDGAARAPADHRSDHDRRLTAREERRVQ